MNLSCTYLACVLLPCGAFAADSLGCLEFQPRPVASNGRLEGTVVNACAKGVTAFNIDLKILYADGTSVIARGGARDFLPSVGMAPPGSGTGAVVPGERRSMTLATLQPAQMQKRVTGTAVTGRSIIFVDATAVGDEQEIASLFRDRREDLIEWTFWKQTFAKYKDRISTQGPLARLIELSGVRTPQRSLTYPHSPTRVEARADMMQGQLEWFDKAIASGSMPRAEAVRWLEEYLARMTTNYEKQSESIR
jgi:hypothetical protein